MSGSTVNPPMQVQHTRNGSGPNVARTYAFQVALSAGIATTFDMRSLQTQNIFADAQGIFVDNSKNATAFTVSPSSGQTLYVPPYSQAMLPLYMASQAPVLTFTGAGTVSMSLLNFPTPAVVWAISGNALPVVGGEVQVYDATVAGLIQNPQGAVSGGVTGTVSELAGGVYQSVALTAGQQSALSLTENGALVVAGPTITPVAAPVFAVTTAGTDVAVFPADSILNGGYIVNPGTNDLYIDMVNPAQTASPGTLGTTSVLTQGQKFIVPGPLTTAVTANGTVAGQTFVAVKF